MALTGAGETIHAAVTQWKGVEAKAHRFGGTEWMVGPREIGHIHGDSLVDIPFPRAARDELVAEGEALPHHILPDSNWVSFYLNKPGDAEKAIALLHRSYDYVCERAEIKNRKVAALKAVESEDQASSR